MSLYSFEIKIQLENEQELTIPFYSGDPEDMPSPIPEMLDAAAKAGYPPKVIRHREVESEWGKPLPPMRPNPGALTHDPKRFEQKQRRNPFKRTNG